MSTKILPLLLIDLFLRFLRQKKDPGYPYPEVCIIMDPKFDSFNVIDVTYKTLNDHPFKVVVLVPKDIDKSKPAPVLVKFHGGGMVFGERLYAPWWPPW